MGKRILISIFLATLAFSLTRCDLPQPRSEPTRQKAPDLRVGFVIELTGTVDFYQVQQLYEENVKLKNAGSSVRKQQLLDPSHLDPGDEVRYLGGSEYVVEKGRYHSQIGWIIPGEAR